MWLSGREHRCLTYVNAYWLNFHEIRFSIDGVSAMYVVIVIDILVQALRSIWISIFKWVSLVVLVNSVTNCHPFPSSWRSLKRILLSLLFLIFSRNNVQSMNLIFDFDSMVDGDQVMICFQLHRHRAIVTSKPKQKRLNRDYYTTKHTFSSIYSLYLT